MRRMPARLTARAPALSSRPSRGRVRAGRADRGEALPEAQVPTRDSRCRDVMAVPWRRHACGHDTKAMTRRLYRARPERLSQRAWFARIEQPEFLTLGVTSLQPNRD